MKKKYISFFAFCLGIISQSLAQLDYTIHLNEESFEPTENIAEFDNIKNVLPSEIVNNRVYRFVQFQRNLLKSDFEGLEERDIHLLNYISNFTYLVSLPSDISGAELSRNHARSIWSLDNGQKLSKDIRNQALPDWAIDGDRAKLVLKYFKDQPQDKIIHLLENEKVEILESNGVNNYLIISMKLNQIASLTNLPFVEFVEAVSAPDIKDDRRGRSLHRVNKMDPNIAGARNYTGKGINILVRDDGKVFEHIDFKGRLNQNFANPSHGSHGDGVAGIFSGAGNLDPVNQGMAYESEIYVLNYSAGFLDETMSLFNNLDVIVTNSSYSNGCNAGYTSSAQTVDQQIFDNPTLLHVFSAGNNGLGTVDDNDNPIECGYGAGLTWGNITGGHKQGKNVIATANLNYRGEIMESSSRGPAYDGRIKPDIAANGNNHVSTGETQGYISFGGTSGAAPVVAGVTAMLHEAYETNHNDRANSALLKAIMLNTANDLGNKGPDYIYGWGSLNGYRSALTIEENRFSNDIIFQDDQKSFSIEVPENVAELRIMTYWPDPEASQFNNRALINDLNTMVLDPNGGEHLPWILDPSPSQSSLDAPAVKGVDYLNNMEQIAIDNPEAGLYNLQIDGYQVPFGDAEYYVVWEFRMNEIDIIFPDGGENINKGSNEVIHWDATGEEGSFEIFLLDSSGVETPIKTVSGNRRLYEWKAPNNYSEFAKIKITRNGITDVSTEAFLLANNPEDLTLNYDSLQTVLKWKLVDEAISYNIYVLGEKYMEKFMTIEADSLIVPDTEEFKYNWIAVSANFEHGSEGKRSVAIATTPPPVALATNNVNDKPCLNQPVIFETQSTDTLLMYNWQFGQNAEPSEATTRGPHEVVFTKKGTSLAALTITNDGGSDQVYFVLNVQDVLTQEESDITDLGSGEYTFKSNIKLADEYRWNFGDGNIDSGKTVTHQYEEAGMYTVTLEAENSCGIINLEDMITVVISTAVEDEKLSKIEVVPNPNHGSFSILLPDLGGEPLSLKLYSIIGEIIDQRKILNTTSSQRIQLDGIAKGSYILNLKIGKAQISKTISVQ